MSKLIKSGEEARKALEAARRGVGAKAQQAIAAAYEERKDERRACARERRAAAAAPERPSAELAEVARKMITASMELAEKVEAA